MTLLSFIIPCYGSEDSIEAVVNEVVSTVETRQGYDYEIILVNDCSPDGVGEVIKRLCNQNEKIKGIHLTRNFGQHAALIAGMNYISGSIVVCLDDDGQTPADECFSLIDELGNGYDIVFAKYKSKKHNAFRNLGSYINERMARSLLNKPKSLHIMSYFACYSFVIEEVVKYKNPYPYISGLLLRVTNRITNVEVNHRNRLTGQSNYTFIKLLSLWFNGFTTFSVKPLRVASLMGIMSAFTGFLYGVYVIANKLLHPETPIGYSSTMAVLLFIGGLILLVLGIIGEYIGRTYISISQAPQYAIRNKHNL